MRLLNGLRNDRHFSYLEKPAVMGNARVGPGLADYVERLQETVTAFGLGDAESFEVLRQRSAPNAELHAPVTEHIQSRNLFCDAYWMRQGQQHDSDPESELMGAFSQGCKQQ